jgi:prepilin-type N-terminal cleavage/methylation domain-containing protein
MKIPTTRFGFTLVELMVVVSVIGILSSIIYANFGAGRAAARDDVRKSALKEVQLALELYKAQYGSYPAAGCSAGAGVWVGPGPVGSMPSGTACDTYIAGLTPDFIATLPIDPSRENESGIGYYYQSNGTGYKLINNAIERKLVASYDDEYARCPSQGGSCSAATPPTNEYGVYSSAGAQW